MKFLRSSPAVFLSGREREMVVGAIRDAESRTSGEVRVCLERRCPAGADTLARAAEHFARLGMTRTALKNGVLIYVALADRRFAILGDAGIHERVGEAEWGKIRDGVATRFGAGEFCKGICEAVTRIGELLSSSFPRRTGDANELPDEISIEE
jgi:uncharacterized membrane protein